MKTIHKFRLQTTPQQLVNMPDDAVILHVGYDPNGLLALWAFVDTDRNMFSRDIRIFGTGHEVEDGLEYLGTVNASTVNAGPFMWHVFERIE